MLHLGVRVDSTHLSLNTSIVADFIQVICGHARLHRCSSYVKNFSSQPAHLAHGLLTLCIQQINFRPAQAILTLWNASLGPVGVLDCFGNRSSRGEWVYGSNRASVWVCWEGVIKSASYIAIREQSQE